jgi:hypothetical protein
MDQVGSNACNQLSALPEAVQGLERLEKLFLHGNPGLGLPDEVIGPTIQEVFGSQKRSLKPSREILDYYFATRGTKGRALAARGVGVVVDVGVLHATTDPNLQAVLQLSSSDRVDRE